MTSYPAAGFYINLPIVIPPDDEDTTCAEVVHVFRDQSGIGKSR